MSHALRLLIAAAVLALALPAAAAPSLPSDAPTHQASAIEFSVKPRNTAERPWTVRLDGTGTGTYSEAGAAADPPHSLSISPSTLQRLRRGEHAAKAGRCETHQKNIAQTGVKTIRYQMPERTLDCTFNFSEDSALMDAVAAFQAIAATMQAGQRLQHDQRFDRLALDAEIDHLVSAARDGSAIEIPNIAPVLQSLIDDEHVIDRVRRKAARLLQDSSSSSPVSETASRDR
ncbi:MAG TPA: hypothetical protein VM865_06070 [Acidobacteriaceae bacterium]|jgi:hypothetical protein|nr:hypothetical protein [Acidobacteriaceae bacterium]